MSNRQIASLALAATAFVVGAVLPVNATTLNITATADNQFSVYLATAAQFSGNQLGTQIGNNPAGNNWQQSYVLPSTPLSNTPLYLQVVLTNWTPANGYNQYPYSPTSNPSAFLADLSLSDSGYKFTNGGSSLSTDAVNWSGSTTSNPNTWVATGPGVQSYGPNSGPSIWFSANGNQPISGISLGADWIYFGDQATALYADLSIEIQASNPVLNFPTPLPAAWSMMLLGLAGFGSLTYRRTRKQTASFAAV